MSFIIIPMHRSLSRNLSYPTASHMHTTGMCLCHYTACSGRFVKGNSSCDSKCKSLGTITTFECCVLHSVQYLTATASHSLYCSKIDMLMQRRVGLCESENSSKNHQFGIYCIKLLRMYVCAWKTEERSLGLPWPTSFPSPLYCLFLCGAVSLPGVG